MTHDPAHHRHLDDDELREATKDVINLIGSKVECKVDALEILTQAMLGLLVTSNTSVEDTKEFISDVMHSIIEDLPRVYADYKNSLN